MSFLAEGTRWAAGLCLTSDRHLIEMSVGVGNILYYPVFGKTNGWFLFFYIFSSNKCEKQMCRWKETRESNC